MFSKHLFITIVIYGVYSTDFKSKTNPPRGEQSTNNSNRLRRRSAPQNDRADSRIPHTPCDILPPHYANNITIKINKSFSVKKQYEKINKSSKTFSRSALLFRTSPVVLVGNRCVVRFFFFVLFLNV